MGDPWADVANKVNERISDVRAELLEEVDKAKRDEVFSELKRLSAKVDAIIARLPPEEVVIDG